MKTLYNAHGKKRNVSISAPEMVKDSNASTFPSKRMVVKIVRMYFKIVRDTVISGHEWRFPNGLRLSIRWSRVVGTSGKSSYLYDENKDQKVVFNSRRINERYSIDMYGVPISDKKYIFEPNSEFCRLTSFTLFNTDNLYQKKVS